MDETISIDELQREVEDLRASRARLAASADAERRRIERSLHDGVQQHLVALAVNLQLARELAESDPAALEAQLAEMAQIVRDALESVRELAFSVYPPLLLDRGLAEALRGAAARMDLTTRVEAEAEARYPPAIEAAAYFCCLEAVHEAVERAGPEARAVVRVWVDEGALCFEVAFDGVEAQPSDMLRSSLRDRLGAVGGRLDVSAALDRGRISGAIPLP